MVESVVGSAEASTEQGSARLLEELTPQEAEVCVRYFVASRANTEEIAAAILNQPAEEIGQRFNSLSLQEVEANHNYNQVLSESSLNERREFWRMRNKDYHTAMEEWKGTFARLAKQEAEDQEVKTLAIKSIMTKELQAKDLASFSEEDAETLYNIYSANNTSNIDEFIKRAVGDATDGEGNINITTLEARLPRLKWVATGFFGANTAKTIANQILLEAQARNNWDNTRNVIATRLRPQAETPEAAEPQPTTGSPQDFSPAPVPSEQMQPAPEEGQAPIPEDTDEDDDSKDNAPEHQSATNPNPAGTPGPDEQSTPVIGINPPTPPENPQGLKENIIEYSPGDTTDLAEWVNNQLKRETAANVIFSIPAGIGYSYIMRALAQGKAEGGTLVPNPDENKLIIKGVKVNAWGMNSTLDLTIENGRDGISTTMQKCTNPLFKLKINPMIKQANSTIKDRLRRETVVENPLRYPNGISISGDNILIKFRYHSREDLPFRIRL